MAGDSAGWAAAQKDLEDADVIVDAVLGTGLRQAPTGLPAAAIAAILGRFEAGVPVVAVDLPSGLPSDGGAVDWPAARATVTVTFAAPKRGHVLPPACDHVGDLVVADIGIGAVSLAAGSPSLFLLEDKDAAGAFPRRRRGAHKGDFGHLLIVAGSVGKAGAAVLAAGGALRSGCGLVTVATPEPCLPVVAAARAEAMTEPLPATAAGGIAESALPRLLDLAAARDAVVIGPGLGQDPGTRALVRAFVRACPVPLVIDADGLNALAPAGGEAGDLGALRRGTPTILTHTRARWPGSSAAGPERSEGAARDGGLSRSRDGRDRRAQGGAHARRGAQRPGGDRRDREPGPGDRRNRGRAGRRRRVAARPGRGPALRDRRGRRARARGRPRGPGTRRGGPHRRGRGRRAAGGDRVAAPRRGRWGIREVTSRSEAQTAQVAETMAAAFRGGEVVLLSGELGAGKTAFVRGLARGLGADPEEVASPTFVLLTAYPGRLTLHHADLYRLRGDGDERELGLEELPGPRGVLAVEWAERLREVPWPAPLRVRLDHAGDDVRVIVIEAVA